MGAQDPWRTRRYKNITITTAHTFGGNWISHHSTLKLSLAALAHLPEIPAILMFIRKSLDAPQLDITFPKKNKNQTTPTCGFRSPFPGPPWLMVPFPRWIPLCRPTFPSPPQCPSPGRRNCDRSADHGRSNHRIIPRDRRFKMVYTLYIYIVHIYSVYIYIYTLYTIYTHYIYTIYILYTISIRNLRKLQP